MDLRDGRPRPQPAATHTQRLLFAAQVGAGLLAGAVMLLGVIGLGGTSAPGGGSLMALVFLGFMIVSTVAVLAWLEARKFAGPSRPDTDPVGHAERVAELNQSRREIVGAFEIERRRIERDLHDGAQQYLVASSIKLGEATMLVKGLQDQGEDAVVAISRLLEAAQDDADAAMKALRNTVQGIHPKVLSDVGLEAAVRDIAARSGLDVTVRVPRPLPPMPEGVVAAAYFFVSEALTNVAKYARDTPVTVLLMADDTLHLTVVDSGPGGAVITPGHGLAGMKERLAAFGGTLTVASPSGGPTTLAARIPLLLREGEQGVVVDGVA